MKNGVSLFGDESGVSLITATSLKVIGEPDNNGSTVANLVVEDLFFFNVRLDLNGTQKDNITIRQCVFASTIAAASGFTQCAPIRGEDVVIEDCIFVAAEAPWNSEGLKGIGTFKNVDMVIRRNIFGLDLGNLSWLDTEWKGYANWTNPENRLWQFLTLENLPSRMGAMRGAMRLNECNGTRVIDNIFNFDPVACGVEQHAGNMDVDHVIYATQAYNTEITANWFRGHPCSPAGGLKHRDTAGPGVIAANYFVDTPLLFYSYENDLVHGFDNQFIYRNHFEILTDEGTFGRNGISYYMTDALVGVNNRIASNTFECADGFSSITLGSADPAEWKVYDSNRYISGALIEIAGNNPPYAYVPGAPPSSETSPYDGYVIPDLDIPEYGEESPVYPEPGVVEFGVSEDAFARQADPDANFGFLSTLNTRKPGTSEMVGYLKFTVPDIPGAISGAKIKLYSLHNHTVEILKVNDVSWSESTLTWNDRPAMNEFITTLATTANQWAELDVSSVVTGVGTYAFGLKTTSGSYLNFSSKEGTCPPKLVVTHAVQSGDGDTDSDLLPNSWAEAYFGNSTNAAPTADADGFDNLSEYIAGSDPTNGALFFDATHSLAGFGFVVNWNSVSSREYSVRHSGLLTNGFNTLTNGVLFPQNSYTDTTHAADSGGFYRVDVKRLP